MTRAETTRTYGPGPSTLGGSAPFDIHHNPIRHFSDGLKACAACPAPLSPFRVQVDQAFAHFQISKAKSIRRGLENSFGAFHRAGKIFLPYVKAESHGRVS
ncbi:hypothetical protein [Aestuariivirga sp.]|uniref:hypothetical protein n=1 Tax=Aestuariivirga sp. TaxID=2650926 RepID=UPI0039E2239C